MANLASAFSNQGRWKEAVEREVQVMETSPRVLRPEHPDALTNMANLAFKFWSLDLKKEAIGEVVEQRQEVIGFDHPDTIQSTFILLQLQDKVKKKRSDRKPVRRVWFPHRRVRFPHRRDRFLLRP